MRQEGSTDHQLPASECLIVFFRNEPVGFKTKSMVKVADYKQEESSDQQLPSSDELKRSSRSIFADHKVSE